MKKNDWEKEDLVRRAGTVSWSRLQPPLYVQGSGDSPLVFPVRALLLLVHLKRLDSGFPALLVFLD